ncbi:unnamed protein product [marine sediment metagenome]|uniref:Uncharacterized protein n=1 Tax=marine sediment metagenome TaxID=412755 RepID=X1HHS9_9ZZZZ
MSSLIPAVSITDFKKLKVHELKRMKSCEVTSDGEYLFTFVNPQTDYIKTQTEYMCQTGNAIGGKSLEEVREAVLV